MIALRKLTAAPGVSVCEVAPPKSPLAPEAVRVAIAAVGICGSDVHAYDWSSGYEFMTDCLPVTLGHEFCGVVQAIGADVKRIRPGDRVVCWPVQPCGTCESCRRSAAGDCSRRRIIGLHCDGGMADFADVNAARCHVIPDALASESAALTEPLGVSVNAVDVAEISPGDAVVVLGPGPIGLGAAWVAQQRGARVLLAGMKDTVRLDCARAMGLTQVVDLAGQDLQDATRAAFHRAPDRVIEASGHTDAVAQALDVLRPGGICTLVGIYAQPCQIDLTRLVRGKTQIRGAHDTTAAAFSEAIALLTEHQNVLSRMITHRLPLAQAETGFAIARARDAVKVMLLPGAEVQA